ncbi:hypothetical protein HYU14_00185 [Candidatus Woesearchaeota archaeon]|nr:hypothetical protein [Candidatus Woesearchaeota archaeon]
MPPQTIAKDTPLAEITLRKYEHPKNLSGRELARKACLSLGLLQPGDSRDVIVDVLGVLLEAKKSGEALSLENIQKRAIEERKAHKLPLAGVAQSNLARQLRRLRSLSLVEKAANTYRIAEFAALKEIFHEKIRNFLLPSVITRVEEYLELLER